MADNNPSSQSAPSYERSFPYGNGKALEERLPHATVPTPRLDYTSYHPVLFLENADSPQYQDDKAGNAAFIQQLLVTRPGKLESIASKWEFDKRRNAQAILPYLFLGPSTAMRDSAFLDDAGITFLLAVRSSYAVQSHPNYLNPATYSTAVNRQTATFDLDHPFDFITRIKPAIRLLVDHLEANTTTPITSIDDVRARVLVCCESGNDRSATFVVAFLMLVYGFDNSTAIQLVHSQRFSISLNDGMRRMLGDFNDLLAAERQVAQTHSATKHDSLPHQQPAPLTKSKKRGFASYDDEDEDMGNTNESFGTEDDRLGVAPFTDAGL